jgi:hypothetical protein
MKWSAAEMSVRAALASIVLTASIAWSSIVPDGPERVRWLGLIWLSIYAGVMISQAAWVGWRWLSSRHSTHSHGAH